MDDDRDVDEIIKHKLDEPMPWIGFYIAAASALCTLAMAADAVNGFRRRKLWFPSRYFSLDATSLTVLAVAMKLPVDLTSSMFCSPDAIAKFSSLIFMCTCLANFTSSLGSMKNEQILANVVGLGILVVTIVADMWIQTFQLREFFGIYGMIQLLSPTVMMLLLLTVTASLAITIPAVKSSLELKYQEMHRGALGSEEEEKNVHKRSTIVCGGIQRGEMMKYWVMAETSSPEFVMARSVLSSTSTLICLYTAVTLVAQIEIQVYRTIRSIEDQLGSSVYGVSTVFIFWIQSIGVLVGTVITVLRWLFSVSFNTKGFKFQIESYWIRTLVDWRDSFSALKIHRQYKCAAFLHDAKRIALTFCVGVQISIVVLSKLLVFISALLVTPFFFLCFNLIIKTLAMIRFSSKQRGTNDDDEYILNSLSRYVILLEGEAELPRRIVKGIFVQAENTIQTGRRKQPKKLVSLLCKSVSFNGVAQFDSKRIPGWNSRDPPNCWTLPLVTLTSIALALPNIGKHKCDELISSVGEGLSLAILVDRKLGSKNVQDHENGQLLVNVRKAAYVSWGGVLLYTKWLGMDLREVSLKCKNSKEALKELSDEAERLVMEFKRGVDDRMNNDPLSWPVRIVAANSMYRISRTIDVLLSGEQQQTDDEGLFEVLSVMIADIFAACFTNLGRVIRTMCRHNVIEKREKSVRKAFLLLGKTEQVRDFVQQREWPCLDRDKAPFIDEWRDFLCGRDEDDPSDSASTTTSSCGGLMVTNTDRVSNEEHLAIAID